MANANTAGLKTAGGNSAFHNHVNDFAVSLSCRYLEHHTTVR
jgi:hypothetical protein